ncbi:biotin transporter BioY [Peribacillus alkalitolerans]|uniref:biotin transporter BioY n=1 Tax=Peribacillus alkalitolerans TaxID=1550385 RepID=UPI0013D738AD|nr:biotin transporter BioY [Peribacillus alkalitolerans]
MENKTFSLTIVSLFASLTSIGAFIKIPLPVVPFTLQILFVFLAGSLLGSKKGMLSQLLYVGIGLIGIPVFASGGGPEYIFRPTFGYLIGFIVAAYVIGLVMEKAKGAIFKKLLLANFIGLIVVYVFGILYLYIALNTWVGTPTSFQAVMMMGFAYSIVQDLFLVFFASVLAKRLYTLFSKVRINNGRLAA